MTDHLDGLSFRKLAVKYSMSKSSVQRICFEELKKLPANNQFAFDYCFRFGNIFIVNGKYVHQDGGGPFMGKLITFATIYRYMSLPLPKIINRGPGISASFGLSPTIRSYWFVTIIPILKWLT